MKLLKQVFLTGLFTLLTVGICFSQVYRIGSINPLTGKLSTHGIEIDQGIQVAVEEFNRDEKVNSLGLRVELFRRDDRSNPDVAINQAEQLISVEKVVALVGGYVDSLVGPISTVASKRGIPYVASASLQSNVVEGRGIFFSRISCMDGLIIPVRDFLISEIKPSRVAIIYAATPGATEFSEKLKKELEKAGISVPIFEKVRPGSPDFSPVILKCRQKKVDFIVAAVFFADHLVFVRQLQNFSGPVKGYLGPWGVAYPSFIKEMGSSSNGLFGLSAWAPDFTYPGTEEMSDRFVRLYTEMFKTTPTTTAMHGYASAKVVLTALEKLVSSGEKVTGETLARAIRGIDITLPIGPVAFDEKGNPLRYRQMVVQIQNEKMIVVYPHDRATGKIIYPVAY
ncbi:ABC transporter substrate-binding protein [Thermodesulforhabdus norvegica]|uniref:Branched-chain amino acid transport system substrate-binding protein n=1 Tax=Thermodesulforhabdus norvegica TaxID=39841 RepID=A0A1I4UQ85_9BACT|nr:ABC transporter substrate-binding protein [Thermodesulforhabdus norvegica]SFM91132.1 branched-chain amino acid transport system substrate-binding protein [Thermodesulforhabdus norvegica]